MKTLDQFFILINDNIDSNIPSTGDPPSSVDPPSVRVSLKDREGKLIEEITENALLSDQNFRDLSGLSIGLTQAKKRGARRILIITSNIFLEILIKNEPGRTWKDNYGFHSDIKKMITHFEQVEVKIISQEKCLLKAA